MNVPDTPKPVTLHDRWIWSAPHEPGAYCNCDHCKGIRSRYWAKRSGHHSTDPQPPSISC